MVLSFLKAVVLHDKGIDTFLGMRSNGVQGSGHRLKQPAVDQVVRSHQPAFLSSNTDSYSRRSA